MSRRAALLLTLFAASPLAPLAALTPLTLAGCSGTLGDTEGDEPGDDAADASDASDASDDDASARDARDDATADSTLPPSDASVTSDASDASSSGSDAAAWCPDDPAARPNEGLVEEPGAVGCPRGMQRVAAFCVDRFEASIVVVAGGKESSWSPYRPPPGDKIYRAVSLRGAVPQGYISGAQAKTACEASGKRLCTNDEWLRACQGPTTTTYPYGAVRVAGLCNDARTPHPAVSCFGTTASWIYSELGWPGINQQADTVDRTGSHAGCVTPEGLYDLMGNVHEWIWDDPSKYADPVKAIDFRGGFYADTKLNGEGCLYRTSAHGFTHWDYSTGFRCCADPA